MPQLIALTRAVSRTLGACELTHLPRVEIDLELARVQHQAYEQALAAAGCRVERVPALDECPDAVFIEDTAVVLDEVAIVTRPGARSRREETEAVAQAVSRYRPILSITEPGTLDGGDVLVLGRRVFVGESGRSNPAGIAQLRQCLAPYGYSVVGVPVAGCLHLKSAVTRVADGVLLANPAWVDGSVFGAYDVVTTDESEPAAANGLAVGGTLIYPACFVRTAARLAERGITVVPVDVSELQKAEGAVTCCSLVFE